VILVKIVWKEISLLDYDVAVVAWTVLCVNTTNESSDDQEHVEEFHCDTFCRFETELKQNFELNTVFVVTALDSVVDF
jgi:hypothetical protein